jgi:hypothetical protein
LKRRRALSKDSFSFTLMPGMDNPPLKLEARTDAPRGPGK